MHCHGVTFILKSCLVYISETVRYRKVIPSRDIGFGVQVGNVMV